MKDIRTPDGNEANIRAGTAIVEVCETTVHYPLEDPTDVVHFADVGSTEPGGPPERGIAHVHTFNDLHGVRDHAVGINKGGFELQNLGCRAP